MRHQTEPPETPGRFTTRPPPAPAPPEPKPPPNAHTSHWRIHHDKVSNGRITLRHASRLHHIGLGTEHNGTTVRILIYDQHITVINADTGEIIRDLHLDPSRDYHVGGCLWVVQGANRGDPGQGHHWVERLRTLSRLAGRQV